MNIVILEGSPNKNGSSNLLAKEFASGAEEIGHNVNIIDAAHANVRPCTGCVGHQPSKARDIGANLFSRRLAPTNDNIFQFASYSPAGSTN